MAWADLINDVYTITARPTLVMDTLYYLKQGVRFAHKQGKFWKDMVVVQVTPDPSTQLQSISLPDNCPRIRQIAYVNDGDTNISYDEVTPLSLTDIDGYQKTGVYWGIGTTLNVRLDTLPSVINLGYYVQPILDPDDPAIMDWLLTDYADVAVLYAASALLGSIGEQEIKAKIDPLLAVAVGDLISDQIEVTGR